jgi:hypothetical protein
MNSNQTSINETSDTPRNIHSCEIILAAAYALILIFAGNYIDPKPLKT